MSPRLTLIVLPLALFAAGVAPPCAFAQQDADRCEGTFCDLYYGGPPSATAAPAKPAAPTPITAPKGGFLSGLFGGGDAPAAPGAAPAKRPFIAVGGGGLAATARGEKAERCEGTLCDLYYGGPAPEQPEQAAAQAGDQSLGTEADVAPPPPRTRRAAVAREEKPRCPYNPADPWRCYR